MATKKIPPGYHTVTPFLMVRDPDALLDFVQKAFGARDLRIMRDGRGQVMHAELTIGDSKLMVGPSSSNDPDMPAALYLYVEDPDALYRKALDAGATTVMPMENQFWGDRCGGVRDRFGNVWFVSSRVEEVSEEEIRRRMQAMEGEHAGAPA